MCRCRGCTRWPPTGRGGIGPPARTAEAEVPEPAGEPATGGEHPVVAEPPVHGHHQHVVAAAALHAADLADRLLGTGCRTPSTSPHPASMAYRRPSERAVKKPLAAGTAASITPGPYERLLHVPRGASALIIRRVLTGTGHRRDHLAHLRCRSASRACRTVGCTRPREDRGRRGVPRGRVRTAAGRCRGRRRSSGSASSVRTKSAMSSPDDPADDLADQPAVGEGVVAVAGPGLVGGRGRGQGLDHVVPVEHPGAVRPRGCGSGAGRPSA